MKKPKVDLIEGFPAISIEQKNTSKNPRSTVATVTDYLLIIIKFLYKFWYSILPIYW